MKPVNHIAQRKAAFLDEVQLVFGVQGRKSCHKTIEFIESRLEAEIVDKTTRGDIGQALDIAGIVLTNLGLGLTSVMTAMLFQVVDSEDIGVDQITDQFGEEIGRMFRGISKIHHLNTSKTRIHADKFIELLLTISDDIRVILIKTAERLYRVRNYQLLKKQDQVQLAHEVSDLYVPLTHRLGLYLVKTEFEEYSMMLLHPVAHREIEQKLKESKKDRETYIAQFIDPIQKRLDESGFRCTIKGRFKSIHSIWKKMQNQGVAFDEVYDLFAIRIILTKPSEHEKADCWQVYSIVTDQYPPNPNRLRDWISTPKPNGYESLHTTVIGPEGRWVEVQIRTKRMDRIAEMGHAAHWRYKENRSDSSDEDILKVLRMALEQQDDAVLSGNNRAKHELYSDQIYVFTPQGDLLKLRKGATVLDFAFGVHTDVGYHCTGAKINGQIVPIRQQIVNGDMVEILTSPNQRPKTDWLNIVVTSKARSRIKRMLRESQYADADEGKEILRRKLEQWKVRYNVTTIHKLVNRFHLKSSLDLYQQIADNKLDLSSLRTYLKQKDPAEYLKEKSFVSRSIEGFSKTIKGQEDYLVIDEAVQQVDYKLAKCCNPIFGDEVFGFVTVKDGVKIHRTSCPNAPQMFQRYPYRIVKVSWTSTHSDTAEYTVNIRVSGLDDIGIVNQISKVISSDLKVMMRAMHISSRDGMFVGILTLVVSDRSHLETIMARVKKVKGVLTVKRSEETA